MASKARHLARLMRHLPTRAGVGSAIDRFVEELADAAIEKLIEVEKRRMVDQCAKFHATSSALLQKSVAALAAENGGRIAYAQPAFTDDNAFAAKRTWLWSGSDDPIHDERVTEYTKQLKIDPLAWPPFTPVASICHPNEEGARAYADAIVDSLKQLGV